MFTLAFDDLQLFVRIATLGTLSAAARERNVPVSQVSRTLARIERRCGARLLHRSTHALALTVEGETFLDYCRRLTGTMDELAGEFAGRTGAASGLVRVAASSVIAQHQLLPSLAGLNRRHPQLRVDLVLGDALVDMAREGIDIAIRTSEVLPESLVARQIGGLGRALYAAPAYLEAAGVPAHPDQLRQHRLISNTVSPLFNHWPFKVDGRETVLQVDGFWRCNDTGLVANMVLQGLGIGRLSTLVADPLVAQGRLVPLLADFINPNRVPIYAVMAGARQRLPKIRACIDYWLGWFGGPDPV